MSCVTSLSVKRRDSVLGLVNWCFQPRPGFGCFSNGLYRFKYRLGSRFQPLPSGLRGLLVDMLVIGLRPFAVPRVAAPPLALPLLFADAAMERGCEGFYRGGLISPLVGGRSFLLFLPGYSLQVAELVSLIQGVRLACHLGFHSVSVMGDNLASLCSLQGLSPFRGYGWLVVYMSRLFNWWWDKSFLVHLFWVPTALNLADPLSRLTRVGAMEGDPVLVANDKFKAVISDFSLVRFVGSLVL